MRPRFIGRPAGRYASPIRPVPMETTRDLPPILPERSLSAIEGQLQVNAVATETGAVGLNLSDRPALSRRSLRASA